MLRNIFIDIQSSTWPAGSSPPPNFLTGNHAFHVPTVLLLIGHLTTPPHRAGLSLSEYWAYVRYLNALTTDNSLFVTKEYQDLDSHQKTILSDDFGVGFTMDYLIDKLNLSAPVDGRYFVKNILGSTAATYTGQSKRGPGKCPDYLAQDNAGNWHIVECKGTQTSLTYSLAQISDGMQQKNTISFPPGNQGQRLVAGLYIGSELASGHSRLTVADPEPEDPVRISEDELVSAADTANRGALAVALQLAGFPASSSNISAPDGEEPGARQLSGVREEERISTLQRKRQSSIRELEQATDRFDLDGFAGRSVSFQLPGLRNLTDGRLTEVKLFNGVSKDFIKRLSNSTDYQYGQDLSDQMMIASDEITLKREGSGNSASLRYGDLYRANIEIS